MKSAFLLLASMFFVSAQPFARDSSDRALVVVPSVDLERYAGTWYEIARLPNPFQKNCTGNVTATYTLLDNGEIEVVNRCNSTDGSVREATGRARKASEDGPDAKLEVRFAPAFLSVLPFVWGNYWIIDLAADYSYAVIGEPDREYFWVLARTPEIPDSTMQGILPRAKDQGYDLSSLVRTNGN